jgi:hypothetical protein
VVVGRWDEVQAVVVPIVFAMVGLAVAGRGIRSIVMTRRFLAVAQEVLGVVYGHRRVVHPHANRGSGKVVKIPILQFTTRSGQRVKTEQAMTSGWGVPDPGVEVEVLYDPADPTRAAMTGTTNGVTAEAFFCILFGIIDVAVCALVLST